jgi:hypothetical protein
MRQKALKNQINLKNEIIEKAKINIVSCVNCGDIFMHYIKDEYIECPYCNNAGENCNFPDYFTFNNI